MAARANKARFAAAADQERPSLFVGGLPHRTTASYVKTLVEAITQPGSVAAVHVKCGYCFVDFNGDPEECIAYGQEAAAKLDGVKLAGRVLGVRLQTAENHRQSRRCVRQRKLKAMVNETAEPPPPLLEDDGATETRGDNATAAAGAPTGVRAVSGEPQAPAWSTAAYMVAPTPSVQGVMTLPVMQVMYPVPAMSAAPVFVMMPQPALMQVAR
eukprot:TRINITY_DN4764_c0_g1_i1.p1 TRINITY_DN4764_c0_g1~~TRINITY_DN4764_c0_g1_i1.p1  ORF type:complete len:213 (+),score=33.99 TRINITY_DN4764_c0_g1_i1:86-724(+)